MTLILLDPTIIQALILATSGLFSIGSMTLVILMLISGKDQLNGVYYAMGYFLGYLVIGISLILFGYTTQGGSTSTLDSIVPFLLILLGLLLLFIGIHNKRKIQIQNDNESRFLKILENITPKKAFGFGLLVTIINFKNLALFLSALSGIVLSKLSLSEKLIGSVLVVTIFCSSVIIPILIFFLFPIRGTQILTKIRSFLNENGRNISIYVPITFGVIFEYIGLINLL